MLADVLSHESTYQLMEFTRRLSDQLNGAGVFGKWALLLAEAKKNIFRTKTGHPSHGLSKLRV